MSSNVADIALAMPDVSLSGDNTRPQLVHLIARASAGEAEAFDQLMLGYQRRVFTTAWRMLGNPEDARDAAQEVFLRVYKHLHKFDRQQDFAGWLYRIIVNVCHDQARRRKPAASLEAEMAAGEIPELPGRENTEAEAILAQEHRILWRALAGLPEKERAALVLRDLEGFTTDEVAAILGSSATTIRSQISAARTKIKQYRERYLKGGTRKS